VILSLLVIAIHAKERRDMVVDAATIVDDNITTTTANNITTTTQIPSILDELLNWQIPDLTQGDPTIATPKQFTASCNMLCSVGWEEDITASTFTKIKMLRCNTVNLSPIEFAPNECDPDSGMCSRVLE
jgi:hypothetical protein